MKKLRMTTLGIILTFGSSGGTIHKFFDRCVIIVELALVNYGFVMLLVVFGMNFMACVTSVASNVYVQIHRIMFDN